MKNASEEKNASGTNEPSTEASLKSAKPAKSAKSEKFPKTLKSANPSQARDRLKREFAVNRLAVFFCLLGALLIVIGPPMLSDPELRGGGILLTVLAVFFFAVPTFFMPYGYFFDREGVTIAYLFFENERYLWRNVRGVEAGVDYSYSSSAVSIFLDLLLSRVLRIRGVPEGKRRRYMSGELADTRRTRRLMNRYGGGKISDPDREEREKRRARKRKASPQRKRNGGTRK